MQLFFKLCSDHLSIEAIPKRRLSVDLSRFEHDSVLGYVVRMWTPYFVVLMKVGGEEITLRRDGRMIVRNTRSEDVAQAAAGNLLKVVESLGMVSQI